MKYGCACEHAYEDAHERVYEHVYEYVYEYKALEVDQGGRCLLGMSMSMCFERE